MQKILHIQASPRTASKSTAAAERCLTRLTADNSPLNVERQNLWELDLPNLDGDTISAKYSILAGNPLNSGEEAAWNRIGELVDRVARADLLIISTPLWNFGVPYRLKHWIDVITQPGLSFSFSQENGYRPLLTDRPALLILSSAGDYRNGLSRGRPDLATPYMKEALAFIGITNLTVVALGPTVGPEEAVAEAIERADGELADFARRWTEQNEARAA
jgi:FMN-dependent NADH-azoreductase